MLFVFKIDGRYDIAVGFLVKEIYTYQSSYEKFLMFFKPYVAEKNFSIFLDLVHLSRKYLVNKEQRDYSSISTGSSKTFEHDSKDIEILNLIKENARISLLDLSKKLNMTPSGAKYKLKNLEKNKVIVAYKLLLNSNRIGYEYYKVDIELEDMGIIPSLKQYIIQHPNTFYQDITAGGSDFEFDVELKSQKEFYEFMDKIKTLFPGKIRDYFYYRVVKIYKYVWIPEIDVT